MKKATGFLLVCALLFLLLFLPSCSSGRSDGALTVKVPKQIIYADSEGELYYVNVDYTQYRHSIEGLHSFAGNAPKSFKGFTVLFEKTPEEQATTEEPTNETSETVVQEDPFSYQTTATADSSPSNKAVRIYGKNALYTALKTQNTFVTFCRNYRINYGVYPSTSTTDVDWELFQQRFADNNALDETITIDNAEYHIVIKLETFTYKETVEQTYVIATDYTITKTPYYDTETGKLAAQRVVIQPETGSSLTYFEYE